MSANVLMQALPGTVVSGEFIGMPSGTVYSPNSNGQILASETDVSTLLGLGFFLLPMGMPPGPTHTTNAATAAATLTGANIIGGTEVYLELTGVLAAAAALTLPTVAALIAALPNPQPGQSYRLRIINDAAAFTWTLTTNTGWTLNGPMTIATATWRDFIVSLQSLTAATLQSIGTGTAP